MTLISYALKRVAIAVPMLLAVTAVTFALTRALPGNPAVTKLGETGTKEMLRAFEEKMGLDRPFYEQYLRYMYGLLHGDLGNSWTTGQPVLADMTTRFPATLELAIWALALALIIGVPLAVFSNLRKYHFWHSGQIMSPECENSA